MLSMSTYKIEKFFDKFWLEKRSTLQDNLGM